MRMSALHKYLHFLCIQHFIYQATAWSPEMNLSALALDYLCMMKVRLYVCSKRGEYAVDKTVQG